MKKILLLSFALLLTASIFAQNRGTLLQESFDGNGFPAGWYVVELGHNNWSVSNSNNAGGEANELKLSNSQSFTGTSRMVTTAVDLSGIENVMVSFKHHFERDKYEHTIGIATSTDGFSWNTGWEKTYNSNTTEVIEELITTPDMGKNNVYFCLYYTGRVYYIDGWWFDDFKIFTQDNIDLRLTDIDIPETTIPGNLGVDFTVANFGSATIESFTVKASDGFYDNDEITFETNIAPFEEKEFSFGETNSLIPGSYHIALEITEVNGSDENFSSSNIQERDFTVALGQTQRIPMIEHFSASTCGPCVGVNAAMAQLTENNPGKFTYTKYPTYWPGGGDPYYIEEALVRIDYYDVGGAPQLFLDGMDKGFGQISNNALNTQYETPAFANVRGAYTIEDNTINIIADFMSYIDMSTVHAFVSVNEKTTTGNVGSNGETEFHHILMKMLESSEGNATSINAGEYQRFEFSYDMSSTNVEEMDDLEVSLWLQNLETKEIFNSHFAYENTAHCYPVQNHKMSRNGDNLIATWEAPESGNPTGYNVYLNSELALENTTELSYSIEDNDELYIVEVVALYDEMSSVGTISSNLDELEEIICEAPTNLNVSIEQDVEDFENNFKVTFSWNASATANQYAIYLDGESHGNTTETTYVIGFDEEGEHYFTVESICEDGVTEQSEAFSFEIKGTSVDELGSSFNIYPNPAKDYVMISGKDIETINIYNHLGILIDRIETSSDNVEINTSGYNSGVYFINVMDKEGRNSTTKAIINK